MSHTIILKNIAKHITLNTNEEALFLSLLEYQKVKSKKMILRQGDVCRHSIFVTNGCLRGFTIDANGFEHVLSFAPQDWWIADMYSLLSQKAGNLNIQAMVDTEMLLLSKVNQEKLYLEIPKFERFFRIITEKSLVAHQQRLVDNLSLTAQQRYKKFCTIYPNLINELPQKQIAAYIGVTPEFLSKMKAQMFKKNK
ncbi:MAG: Crp/Fnr family transcriptional regulator [Chitinophagales bacterium]|jgi:CRP-like cAMP-binding protein|nr:Crp/Fnr family transcriptional regulator [Chitinophagales bacterium]